ncbi:MAG: trehalose-6-phosphate synthase [Gemmatimonadota bacterium]|nr:trehalose-6-phosphate synthase [Gemmatimonadota bacterium]
MRLSLRFIVPLLLALTALAYAVMPLADSLTVRWFVKDLDLRASLIAHSVDEPIQSLIAVGNTKRVVQFFERITQDERLYAMAYCPTPDAAPIATHTLPKAINCQNLATFSDRSGHLLSKPDGPLLISIREIGDLEAPLGKLVLVQDMSFVNRRSEETKRYLFYFFIGLGAVVSLLTVIIAQISWRGWVAGVRTVLSGHELGSPSALTGHAELRPIADDLRTLIRDLEAEHRLRDESQVAWTPVSLREILHRELRDEEVIVVSNREPYIHVAQGDEIVVQRPASGLVTAMEPIMRACSGTWIAHGSGSADRRVVDDCDLVGVPAEAPAYQLRRVWLTEEEERGYYYGFSNEGLWPLCHIAHVRPAFRGSDWKQYVKVNQKFAQAVVAEARSPDPVVLVQDYHLALLPRMIREALPNATVITFWHIPWPNPEAFGICPWREELLDGLLGSDILGFHTQFHCNNFLDTVDRLLEARVDRENFNVSYMGGLTAVKRYPISIEWPTPPELVAKSVDDCRAEVRSRHNLPADHLVGLGVDRFDYTKGIEERFRAVERLLEENPEWIGKFSFIQIAAPTRASITEYRDYNARVREVADGINARFTPTGPPSIILVAEHREPLQVYEYYRAVELCFVSSLHDGMNLVAKEFVAARDDDRGVLILSRFTGAARELPEALIVNPYDVDQCAAALHTALSMPASTQRARMQLMRGLVAEFNVYRWAGRMLLDAAVIRRRKRVVERSALTMRHTRRADRRASPRGEV